MTTAEITAETRVAIDILRQSAVTIYGIPSKTQGDARRLFEEALGVDEAHLIAEGATLQTDLVADVVRAFSARVDWAEVLADLTQRRNAGA